MNWIVSADLPTPGKARETAHASRAVAKLTTTADDDERYLADERKHLENLKKEPDNVTQKIEYMERLEKQREAQGV